MISVQLGQAGYEAILAANVTEAMRLAKSKTFDLILLDWYLNDGTGVELCEAIRGFDLETPIFFYTGVAIRSEIKKAIKAGAQGCFIKPVLMEDLLGTLGARLSKKSGNADQH
jgi:two-component system response regulator AtoC